MKERIFIMIVLSYLFVCGMIGVAWANPVTEVARIVRGFHNPNIVPGNDSWLRLIMDEERLFSNNSTEKWLSELTTKIENGEIDAIDFLRETSGKMIREVGGERSKRRDKIAIRLIYFSAGIDPDISRVTFQGLDSRINASSSSDLRLYEMIDPDDIEIRPAKPYFNMTLGILDDSHNIVETSLGAKMVAIRSIEGGHARFSAADYEAAALTRMDKLRPANYEKAVKSHANLFDGGFYNSEKAATRFAYRVKILSSPYFEFSGRTTDSSRLASQMVLNILEDVSRGHTSGFTKESVLKLRDIVYNGDEKINLAFREAIGEMVFRNTLGDMRPEGAQVAGGSFMSSLVEAVKEDNGLYRLFNEVAQEVNPSSTVSPSVVFQ